MSDITCEQVQEQLDLLAAGACDPATQAALEQHLGGCSVCAAQFAASQRLHGLLDVHFNQQGLERLKERIDEQARPARKPRRLRPFAGGVMAAAAVILVAIGLVWWLPDRTPQVADAQFALLVETRAAKAAVEAGNVPSPAKEKIAEALNMKALKARGQEARAEIVKAQRDGKMRQPTAVALDLTIVNKSDRAVEVRFGDEHALLTLELPAEGVLRLPAPNAEEPEFLKPRLVQLAPEQKHVVSIDRLVAGSRSQLAYIYLTEPGDYSVTASLRFSADGKAVTVTGAPVRITIEKQP